MEFLVVSKQHFLHALVLHRIGEQGLAQLVQRHIGNPRHPLCRADIPLGAGGGLEHEGIRQNRRRHHARQSRRGHQAPILEHAGDDGIGGANRLVAHINGIVGLHIRQPVVIDDLQDFRLVKAQHGLGRLVMVNQHHPFSPGPQQMIPGQNAHYFFLRVQNRVAGVAVFEHHLADIVHPVV